MKLELLIFGITGFLILNTYYDGKYTKMLQLGHKYFKMAMFGFVGISIYLFIKKNPKQSKSLLSHANDIIVGISIYLFIKKNPKQSKSLLSHANDIIRYMPIDKNTADMVSPFFDLTNMQQKMSETNIAPQTKRMMRSGQYTQSRSVSETKKKYIASQQSWKCAHCKQQLAASFQVDHIIRLADGGTNHIDNLEALCCNCHGKKTMIENMK